MSAATASAQRIEKELPVPARGLEIQNHSGKAVPLDLSFTTDAGKAITLRDLFGKPIGANAPSAAEGVSKRPVVVMMMYLRCPLLCPKALEELTATVNGLDFNIGSDFDVVCVSFDPRDTTSDAATFKSNALLGYNRVTTDAIRNGWTFLTGTAESSKALADALGFRYRYMPDSGEYSHGTALFVLTPEGTISRYLPGFQSTMEFPVRDTRLALVEAAKGKIGTVFDLFTLWCYHYDPKAGSYVLQAMRVMQIGGGLTAVAIGTLVGSLLYAERRRRRQAGVGAVHAASLGSTVHGAVGVRDGGEGRDGNPGGRLPGIATIGGGA